MLKTIRYAVLVLIVAIGIGSLSASPPEAMEYYYYTDGTYTEQCGYFFDMCWGASWGGCETQWVLSFDDGPC
jgi:hypothetical protein